MREHLENLKVLFPQLLGESKIHESIGTDYAFRIFVDKAVWAEVLSELAGEVDYDNFKSEVARHGHRAGVAYEQALHDVWAVMRRLQK